MANNPQEDLDDALSASQSETPERESLEQSSRTYCEELHHRSEDSDITNNGLSSNDSQSSDEDTLSKRFQDIHRVPIEILSIIFLCVNEAIFDYKFDTHSTSGVHLPHPRYEQPSQSPPLLVGAVCKRWRDITLTTPRLWTDIIIDLSKSAEGQLMMVDEWANRSRTHPLDLTIFTHKARPKFIDEAIDHFKDVFAALRLHAARWSVVAFDLLEPLQFELFDDLEEVPPIRSLFIPFLRGGQPRQINLPHPLHPTCLVSHSISSREIPFEWDRLVFLEMCVVYDGEILEIIRHAPNLTHCIAGQTDSLQSESFPMPTNLVVNHSLVYLQTKCCILGHLTLPSLQHLDYATERDHYRDDDDLNTIVQTIVQFIERSSPPLEHFSLGCILYDWDNLPPLERLPGITHLSVTNSFWADPSTEMINDFLHTLIDPSPNPILPRLQGFSFTVPELSASSWALLSQLFPDPSHNKQLEDTTVFTRPLLYITIALQSSNRVEMNDDTVLRLNAVRKSGKGVYVSGKFEGNLWL